MEAYPLSPRNNAELRCKDVIEVFEIVRSKLGNHKQPVEQARLFAKMLGPSSNTINHFISKISCLTNRRVELSFFHQIKTATESLISEQDSTGHSASLDDHEAIKESSLICGNKVCLSHLLDLVIVLMAAAGNFNTALSEASAEPKDKTDEADCENTANPFKTFSLRLWRRGVKSAGLLRDKTKTTVSERDTKENCKNDAVASCDGIYENKEENEIRQCGSQQVASKSLTGKEVNGKNNNLTEKTSLRSLPSSLGNENFERTKEASGDNNSVQASQHAQKKQRRKLPQLKESFEGKTTEERGGLTVSVKKLQMETETLRNEAQALRSQLDVLVKYNKDVKDSLASEKTERVNAMQKCKELQRKLDEHDKVSRERAFLLNSRLERLQHAKLAADQGCLKFSLRQERFEVYEEQATLLCKKSTEVVKKELEERRGLYAVEHRTFDDFPSTGDGLTMYEAHRELQNNIVELIKRYRADLKLLTGTRDGEERENSEEFIRDFYGKESIGYLSTIEERQDSVSNYLTGDTERYRIAFGMPLESAESSYAMNHHVMNDVENEKFFTSHKRQDREKPEKPRRRPGHSSKTALTDEYRDQYSCQKQERDDLDLDETKSLKDFPSCSGSMVSKVKQYPKRSNSLNTIDEGRHHVQRSCSSIVALMRSSQRSSNTASGVKKNYIECSACKKNKEQRKRIKKSSSSCKSRDRMSDIYYL